MMRSLRGVAVFASTFLGLIVTICSGQRVFDATKFGATPNTNGSDDDSVGVQRAIDEAVKAGNGIVLLPNGVYDFFVTGNPPTGGVRIKGGTNITIGSNGATIMMHGFDITNDYADTFFPSIVLAENSTNVRVVGLRLDYARPPYSVGRVVGIDPASGTFDVRVYDEFPMPTGTKRPTLAKLLNFDRVDRPLGDGFDVAFLEPTDYAVNSLGSDPQLLRIHAYSPLFRAAMRQSLAVAEQVVLGHATYTGGHPLQFFDCDGIRIDDVRIWAGAMGIYGERNSNVRITNLRVERRAGTRRLLATLVDGVHFVHTKGHFELTDSLIERNGDDALNIEGRMYRVDRVIRQSPMTIVLEESRRGGLPAAASGERFEFYEPNLASRDGTWVVRSAQLNTPSKNLHTVVLDGGSRTDPPRPNDWSCNLTRSPTVKIRSCAFRYNVRHGVILHARDSSIRSCEFEGNTSAAIAICADVRYWMEGPPPINVTIADCTIRNDNAGARRTDASVMVGTVLRSGRSPIGTLRDIFLDRVSVQRTPRGALSANGVDNLRVNLSDFTEIGTEPGWWRRWFMRFENSNATITNSWLIRSATNRIEHVGAGAVVRRNNSGF